MSSRFDTRLQKARVLANTGIVRSGDAWLVPSLNSELVYRVTLDEHGEPQCTCADFQTRRLHCKHIIAANLVAQRERVSA